MSPKVSLFRKIILDFVNLELQPITSRSYVIPMDVPKIISLIGPRRVGKTYMMYNVILELRKTLPPHRAVYINLEDDRLFPLQLSDMDSFLQAYYELYPDNKNEKVYFFFDEVQEVAHWEKFIRRLWDQENCQVFITGSSSRLLSRELATTLRGRTIPIEVQPLSFAEFLQFKKINPDTGSSAGQARLKNELRQYMAQGGFPELLFLDQNLHRSVVAEYLDIMLYKDLTERFGVKNIPLMKYLLKYLMANVGGLVTRNKIFNDLKSQGFAVAKNTVYEYTAYLEEAFVVFFTDILSRSVRKQSVNPSKVYVTDPAFKYAMNMSSDEGRVLENMVYTELRRRGQTVNYYAEKNETDFITNDNQPINVCMDLADPSTRKREVAGLMESMARLETKNALLISFDEEETLKQDGHTIQVVPFWKWALDK